jgi:2-keto-4-pentenoate hydratase/2-oxohepta-3-ene-1,7-dioic acid hydratase in catechol pathway
LLHVLKNYTGRNIVKIISYRGNYGDRIGIETDRGIVDFSGAFQLYNLIEKEQICPMIIDIMELIKAGLFDVDIFADVLIFLERHSFIDRYIARETIKLNPPLINPSKIVALGLNYADHAKESGRESPKEPVIFCKATSSIIGPEDKIVIKPEFGRVDPEVEFAVIIGRRAKNVKKDDAGHAIAGYTVLNDVSARNMQSADFEQRNPWFRSKSIDTFCPIGPCITLPDEIPPLAELDLNIKVNGETRQNSNTRQLIFNVPTLIEYISSLMTLEPGDIISTGTPSGIAPIHPGDIVEATVEKIGTLRNYVRHSE